jgi:hypothetical protein
MAYTLAQVEAVMKERGMMPEKQEEEQPTLEQVQAEMKRRGMEVPSNESSSTANTLANEQGGWLKGLGQQGLNSLGNLGASLGNLPAQGIEKLGFDKPYNIHHPKDLPPAQNLGEIGGRSIAKSLPTLLPFAGAAGTASLIPKAAEEAGLIAKLIHGGARLGGGGLGGAVTGGAINEGHRKEGAKEGAIEGVAGIAIPEILGFGLNGIIGRDATKAQKALQKAMAELQQKEGSLAAVKGEAKANQLPTDMNVYPHAIANKNEKLQEAMQQHAANPREEFPEQVLHEGHTQLVPRAEEHVQNVDNLVSRFLQHGEPNDESLARQIAHHFEGVPGRTGKKSGGFKQDLGRVYDSIDNDLKGKFITETGAPSSSLTDKQLEEAAEKALGPNAGPKQKESFMKQEREHSAQTGPEEKIDADKYFKKYRTLRLEGNDDIARAYRGGLTPEAHDEWKLRGKKKLDEAERMEQVLEHQIGGEPLRRLKAINRRYAREYAPLNENEIYQKMVHGEKIDARDLAHALRGNSPGNAILRQYIQSNPDAAYLMAAKEFSANPERLLNLNRTSRQYINERNTPELHHLIQEQVRARNAVPIAAAQQHHFTELHKSVQNAFKEHQKAMELTTKLEKDIPKLQSEIQRHTAMEAKLRHAESEKGISKAAHDKKKEALKEALMKKNKARSRLQGIIKTGYLTGLEEYNRRNPPAK